MLIEMKILFRFCMNKGEWRNQGATKMINEKPAKYFTYVISIDTHIKIV